MSTINMAAVARLVGINRVTLYKWRETRPVLYKAIMEYAQRHGT